MNSSEVFKVEADDSLKNPAIIEKSSIEKAEAEQQVLEFFRKHKKFLETYAGDSTLEIKPASDIGLDTFAIDLEKGHLYAHPKFFEKKNYSDEKSLFATLHEYEHFRELRSLIHEKGGDKVWQRHSKRMKSKRHLHIFDNCVDDVKMNRSVISRAGVLEETKDKLYREDQFPETDYTKFPKHLQFAYAILRERMLPEKVLIDPEVRSEIDKLNNTKNSQGVSIVDFLTSPEAPMSMRLKLQERILEPVYEKFFREDVEEKKKKPKDGDGGDKKAGEPQAPKEGEGNPKPEGEKGEPQSGAQTKSEGQGKPQNPEDYFKEEYDEYFENRPEPISHSDIDKAVEEYTKTSKEAKTTEEMAREAYSRAEGI